MRALAGDRGGECLSDRYINNRTKLAWRCATGHRKRRWIVEGTFALGNYRCLAVRYDRSLTIYRGFFHIACFMIVLRRVLK
jgi:hypothetical protein